jgi:hypothetical protein
LHRGSNFTVSEFRQSARLSGFSWSKRDRVDTLRTSRSKMSAVLLDQYASHVSMLVCRQRKSGAGSAMQDGRTHPDCEFDVDLPPSQLGVVEPQRLAVRLSIVVPTALQREVTRQSPIENRTNLRTQGVRRLRTGRQARDERWRIVRGRHALDETGSKKLLGLLVCSHSDINQPTKPPKMLVDVFQCRLIPRVSAPAHACDMCQRLNTENVLGMPVAKRSKTRLSERNL